MLARMYDYHTPCQPRRVQHFRRREDVRDAWEGGNYRYSCIGVGSALLVQVTRAMRRPPDAGTGNRCQLPRFFISLPHPTSTMNTHLHGSRMPSSTDIKSSHPILMKNPGCVNNAQRRTRDVRPMRIGPSTRAHRSINRPASTRGDNHA